MAPPLAVRTASPVPTLGPRPGVSELALGFSLPFRAIPVVLRSPRLLGLAVLCGVVTLATLIALAVGLWAVSPHLLGWVWSEPPGPVAHAAWEALRVVVFAALFAVGATSVPLLLLAPLQDPLCDATESLCGGFSPPPFSLGRSARQTAASLGHTVVRLAWLLVGHVLLFPLNLIPGVGNIAWTVGSTLWTVRWASVEYLDAAMGRHLYPLAAVQAGLKRRRALGLGFGFAVFLLLWVPVLNAFLVPLALVGGTLLYRALRASGDVPGPEDRPGPPRQRRPPGAVPG